ncbi:MAG: ATP-binding cassette domain-containing protein [Pseudomonadota bacterium]
MTAIEVQELTVTVGESRLLGPVSFHVPQGGTLVIMGETGAGKSLMAQAILGTLPGSLFASGKIAVNGRRIDDQPMTERARLWGHELASLPQEPWRALDPLMASWKQVAEAHRHVGGLDAVAASDATAKDLTDMGLQAQESRLPGALSGGMAQRVAFAAATAGGAPILLADEPTKGLDQQRQAHVVNLLAQVPENGGTLIAITHDIAVAAALGGNLIVLRDGDVVEAGVTGSVLQNPQAEYTKELISADPRTWPEQPDGVLGDTILIAETLAAGRAGKVLINGFDMRLHAGQRIALTGPSGIGKTTLLDTLGGLIRPLSGRVVRGESVGRHGVQKLYQDPPAAFPPLVSLGSNLQDVARRHDTDWSLVLGHLADLNLPRSLLERHPEAVSGGELQRLSLVRALIVQPKVLLADEPTNRLDPITQKLMLDLLARVSEERQIAIVLVTHNELIASKWAGRSFLLNGTAS